jgi:hypothetical protein
MALFLPRLALLGCVLVPLTGAAQQKPPKPKVPAIPLATAGLAGQGVAVLPLTMVVGDPRVPGTSGPAARAVLMQWSDSLLGDTLAEQAPEVGWVFPAVLRRTAQRAAGLLPSPDRMGQSVMRGASFKEMPDPLRSYVRQLLALSGGARYALIPAALYLSPAGGDSLTVQLAAVLADGRLGRVVWRTLAVGTGETADAAYRAALATFFLPDPAAP